MRFNWCPPCEGELSGATSKYELNIYTSTHDSFCGTSYVLDLTAQTNTLLSFPDMSAQATLSSMPCSLCNAWDENPSWHRCDAACVDTQGTARLHSGEEIRCSRSQDGTWWFFFCNQCKKARPRIIGVLRKVRIWHSPYLGQIDYTTDSENASYSYSSSEGESCTQEEAEEFFSIQETVRDGME